MSVRIEVKYKKPPGKKDPLDLRPAFAAWHAYMVKQTDEMFVRAGGPGSVRTGGSWRGVFWKPLADQYVRKDGTRVPAWGGVPKVRGVGFVQARKRPSGKPITPLSALLQDTSRLRQRAATEVVEMGPDHLEFGTRLKYAAVQNARRPFLFVTQEDVDYLAELIAKQIKEA